MYHIVVITTQCPEYKLVWLLNHLFSVDFRKLPDLMILDAKNSDDIPYNLYGWVSNTDIDYFLISAIRKPSTLAFETFLLIQSRERLDIINRWVEQISTVKDIFSVMKINPYEKKTSLAHRKQMEMLNNIAIDLEKHVDELRRKPKYPLQRKNDPLETKKDGIAPDFPI